MKAQLVVLLAVLACGGCKSTTTTTNTAPPEDPRVTRWKERAQRDAPVPEFDLTAPADASAADLEATAKAMTDRAASYGYKEVTARVIQDGPGPRVRLACPTGITKEMRQVLRVMGAMPGQAAEIRLYYVGTKAESEQNLYSWEKKTTPPGAKWYQQFSVSNPEENPLLQFSVSGPRLLLDEPVLRAPELRGPKLDEGASYVVDLPPSGKPDWKWGVFLVDGQIVTESLRGYPSAKTLRIYVGDHGTPLGHCLKFPMPLRLAALPSTIRWND